MDESESSSEEDVSQSCPVMVNVLTGPQEEEEFYTPGTLELLAARRGVAEYSLPRCPVLLQDSRTMRCAHISHMFIYMQSSTTSRAAEGGKSPTAQSAH